MAEKKHKKRRHNKKPAQANQQGAQGKVASDSSAKKDSKGVPAERVSAKDRRAAAKAAKQREKEMEAKAKAKEQEKNPSWWRRFINYWKAVRIELRRVVWPTREETVNASLIVVGAILFFGIYIAIIDNIIIIPLDWISSLGR